MSKRYIPEQYYNGYDLLEQTDENNNIPSIYLSNTNRSAGKTTFFQVYTLDKFLEEESQFILISRKKNEMENCETMYDNVIDTYYPDMVMDSKDYVRGLVKSIRIGGKTAGFAVCLKDAVALKKYSSIFSRVKYGIFDELQPEDGKYLQDEVEKMISIISTISRGGGEQSRNVKFFLLSNNICVMNPYFLNLGIYKKLPEKISDEAQYVRGDGYVAEFLFNQSAAKAIQSNSAANVFRGRNSVMNVTAEFMINSNSFILEKKAGKSQYLYTLKYHGKFIGVRKYTDGIVFLSKSYDKSFKDIVAITTQDHDELTIQLRRNTFYIQILRDAFAIGKLYFSDLEIKNDMINLLGIDYYR